jgi:hypothetical protein
MVGWQKTGFTREPPKTKAELRQMLTDAVRNTQASADGERKRTGKIGKTEKPPVAVAFVE